MKQKNLFSILLGLAIVFGAFLTSCDDDPDPTAPTLTFIAEADAYEVTITAEATDASTWAWSYGDDNTSTEVGSHSYTYAESGEYTITCTVTGDGGEVIKMVDVTIAASIEELISGGPLAVNGKTWVVTTIATTGKDGVSIVDNDLELIPDLSLIPDNMLEVFGLGDEYDNEYTFFDDGTYVMNPVNGQIVAGLIHGVATQTITIPSNSPGDFPFCAAMYATPEDGTWALSTETFSMLAIMDPSFQPDGEEYPVSFTFPTTNKLAWFDLSAGQFLGIYDAFIGQQDAVTILKSITAEKMHLVILICGDENNPHLPTLGFHITMVPKE